MSSEKTVVIEHLFRKYWDDISHSLRKTVMTLDDVAVAIRECNEAKGTSLSDLNPANFMKDFMRGNSASRNWPDALTALRYSAVQRTGTGDVFEFIHFTTGQTEAFTDTFRMPDDAPRYPVQSISLPLVTKSLGRSDEAWLIQTAINLRIVETHFAIGSTVPMVELSHLQMNVKLRQTEIDGLFLGLIEAEGGYERVIVTCEAKHYKDPFIPQQIINQVQAAFGAMDVTMVIPLGLKAVKKVGFYVTEFQAVRRDEAESLTELTLASHGIYELHPAVKGI